mgnify:CR=1 FL=1
MPSCIDCEAPATHQRRCETHWRIYRQRPGVRARERRTEALRAGQDAAAQLRKRIREDFTTHGIRPRCAVCGATPLPSLVDIDHIRPLYQGGEDVPENVQVLCSSRAGHHGCHDVKTDMDASRAPF